VEKFKTKIKAVYDNQGKTFDRFTVVFEDIADYENHYTCLGMSFNPTSPQGIGQHSSCKMGKHMGKRIKFDQLPEECQIVVKSMYIVD